MENIKHLIEKNSRNFTFRFPTITNGNSKKWDEMFDEIFCYDNTVFEIGEEVYFGNIELNKEELEDVKYLNNEQWINEMMEDYQTLAFKVSRKLTNLYPYHSKDKYCHLGFLYLTPVYENITF